jgi:acyl CoA:acetate/3-ketoacid CoA transferase
MKYAFILGSNAFITSHGAISYNDKGETKEFIKINKTVKNKSGTAGSLDVSVDIKDTDGASVKLTGSIIESTGFHLEQTNDRIKLLKPDNSTIIDIHELSDKAAAGLSHHIIAELDTQSPITVIRLFGHFMAGSHHISIDNEKVFIDGNSYAESVHVEHHDGGIVFASEGVVL